MNRAYRYRIYPDKKQNELFSKTFGCCRFIYNMMLSDKKEYYEKYGESLNTTPAQYKGEYPWLKEVDSLALANVQLNLQNAYKNFFRDTSVGFPEFKAKRRCRAAYTTNAVNGNIRIENGKLRLPKAGYVKIKLHRNPPENGKLKSVTVCREPSGKCYASIMYEIEAPENQRCEKKAEEMHILGIDYAQSGMGVMSEGGGIKYGEYYRRAQKKLAREQRKLSGCEKGSRNYEKQRKKVAKCYEKIRHQREDFQHKLSRKISEEYDAVAVEDLNMKALSRCLHLGKGVMDNGYGLFLFKLEYKLKYHGKMLIKVDRFYPSSKTCSVCGRVKERLELSERIYTCECGNEMDRDLNAAINIREEGRRIIKDTVENCA